MTTPTVVYWDEATKQQLTRDCTPDEITALKSAANPPFDANAYSAKCEAAVQGLMDTTAQSHGYDSLERCITYKDSSVLLWQHEGQNALAWRDACWTKAQQMHTDATAGNWPTAGANQIPTVAQVLAAMPPANWPTA